MQIANYIIGGLLFEEGKKGNNPLSYKINVEEFFNSVLILAERNAFEATPFISSWHPMVEELDQLAPNSEILNKHVRELVENFRSPLERKDQEDMLGDLNELNQEAVYTSYNAPITPIESNYPSWTSVSGNLVEKSTYYHQMQSSWDSPSAISKHNHLPSPSRYIRKIREKPYRINELGYVFQQAIEESQPKPGRGQIFQDMAESMIRILTDILWIKEKKLVNYLCHLINLARERGRLVIATLNYDNSIELASSSQLIKCNVGIGGWSETGSFDILDNHINLLKLHGSIDWGWNQNIKTKNRPIPHSTVEMIKPEDLKGTSFISNSKPAILFGHKNKLTAEGPFLDLLRTFKGELMQKDTELLTVIGYSFGDIHINTYITQWLYRNPNNCIRIIDPFFQK